MISSWQWDIYKRNPAGVFLYAISRSCTGVGEAASEIRDRYTGRKNRSSWLIFPRIDVYKRQKVAFAHLEEHSYVPTFSIDPDDFILIQIYVRGNKAEIFLAFITMANVNYLGRKDFTILYNIGLLYTSRCV